MNSSLKIVWLAMSVLSFLVLATLVYSDGIFDALATQIRCDWPLWILYEPITMLRLTLHSNFKLLRRENVADICNVTVTQWKWWSKMLWVESIQTYYVGYKCIANHIEVNYNRYIQHYLIFDDHSLRLISTYI